MIKGLTNEQVVNSRQQYGSNQLTEVQKEGFLAKLVNNFNDPIIKILCGALLLNVVFAFLGQVEWYESVGIAMAVILATFVSTYSEYKNENAFAKLQEEASIIKCKVYRNDSIEEISINDIVVNDFVMLETGDKIPADGILIEGEITVNQATLNGESKEALKKSTTEVVENNNDLSDPYQVFRGTVVVSGNAVLQVRNVGNNTVYGAIATELQSDDNPDTPLKVKLTKLAEQISTFGYIGGIGIAIAYLINKWIINNGFDINNILIYLSNYLVAINDIVEAVMLAVIIIVMAVPEGLPLMIAIVSSQNMGKMLKDNVLVRKLVGIETAGSLNILFTDKTGTLTKGKLEVVEFVLGNGLKSDKIEHIAFNIRKMLDLCLRFNATGKIDNGKVIGGNMTERATLQYIIDEEPTQATIIDSKPFNSTDKYSIAKVDINGVKHILIKGAPEKIIKNCTTFLSINSEEYIDKNKLEKEVSRMAQNAMRVLAVAYTKEDTNIDTLPEDLIFVGLLGIKDDIREEAVEAIKLVHSAGVQVVMITGDRQDTATAIAKQVGIITKDTDVILSSEQLNDLDDNAVKLLIPKLKVVSRALPSDKSRLVRLSQELNLVVGMTGDGVNDAPALKSADVGFAMGGGTEVAKEASEIVILDDNFASIEKAILYGRTIFNSIRKFIVFQLTINVCAVLISFISPFLGITNPLSITQILWVNLVMDTLAALAFGGEPALKKYMKEKPKRREEHIINKYMYSAISCGAIWTFIVSLYFLLGDMTNYAFNGTDLLTGYFAFFIFTAVFNGFNARTEQINILDKINLNKGFLLVMSIIAVVQIIMTYFGGDILRCYGLSVEQWFIVICMAFSIVLVDILRKVIISHI